MFYSTKALKVLYFLTKFHYYTFAIYARYKFVLKFFVNKFVFYISFKENLKVVKNQRKFCFLQLSLNLIKTNS